MYQFTDDCRIGIPEIDNEHHKLFEIINETLAMLRHNPENIREIAHAVHEDLMHYAMTHFAHEEAYMERTNDPELARQKKEHAAFIEKMSSYDLDALPDDVLSDTLTELLKFLTRWLYKHILNSDTMIGK